MNVKEKRVDKYIVRESFGACSVFYEVYDEEGDLMFDFYSHKELDEGMLRTVIGIFHKAFDRGFNLGKEAKAREIREALGIRRL